MDIVDFYKGNKKDADGNTINDFLNFDDEAIDSSREFVPWVFPADKESRSFPNSPLLTEDQAAKFRDDKVLQDQVRAAVNRFAKFLHGTDQWRSYISHHHTRISRMIRFLNMIGLEEEATKVANWCIENAGASKKVKVRWADAAMHKPEWAVKAEEKALADADALRESALSKLTAEERAALGLPPAKTPAT